MKKLIIALCFMVVASVHAATVEEVHIESYQGQKLATYRGVCEAAGEEAFVVQLENKGFRYHGPAGQGITREARMAIQAACADEQVTGLKI